MEFYARVDGYKKQKLKDNIEGVYTKSMSMEIEGLSSTQQLLAKLHDFGKYSVDWQNYLLESQESRKEKIPHSPHGAHFVSNNMSEGAITLGSIFSKDMLQYVILAHHGLFDGITPRGKQSLDEREASFEDKYMDEYQDIIINFFKEHSVENLAVIMDASCQELENICREISSLDGKIYNKLFAHGVVMRMLLSVLIDSDWRDAANFSGSIQEKWNDIKDRFSWKQLEDTLANSMEGFTISSEIDELRNRISHECMDSHKLNSGIYRLKVPTGGGKTLSVMRFALSHAREHNKDRIIYTAPFKSIIDQTAEVYRSHLIGDDYKKFQDWLILEHHGDVIRETNTDGSMQGDEVSSLEIDQNNSMWDYLTDSWGSPIILTTLVQLLNTMFSHSKRSIRRCHSLYNSVLIIDEFQTVPVKSKTLFHGWLNVISKIFKVTVVLCTATQPPLMETIFDESTKFGIQSIDYSEPKDLVGDYYSEDPFQRTRVVDNTRDLGFTLNEIKILVESRMEEVNSLLVILNTREAVRKLSEVLKESDLKSATYFLSNNMAPAHRKCKLKEIINGLDNLKNRNGSDGIDRKILVISTSLIEAGVDISFEEVIRSLAGLDSISQSAGRCNRNGETDLGLVRIINPIKEVENVSRMDEVSIAQEVVIPILNDFKNRPEDYNNDLMSHNAIETYFRRYYEKIAKLTHYPISIDGVETTLYQLLSGNKDFYSQYAHINKGKKLTRVLNQAFLTAGELYEPIEDKSIRILTHWARGKDLVIDLGRDINFEEKKVLLKEAEQYSVAVYAHQFQKLRDDGAIYTIGEREVWILQENYYNDSVGLVMDPMEFSFKEGTISF